MPQSGLCRGSFGVVNMSCFGFWEAALSCRSLVDCQDFSLIIRMLPKRNMNSNPRQPSNYMYVYINICMHIWIEPLTSRCVGGLEG